MKIVSYNVNGIRAAIGKGLISWLKETDADICCFQEIKANVSDIPISDFEALGYHSYWFSAQKKGYSGVAVLCKEKPISVQEGCGLEQADYEGRVLKVQFEAFELWNTYFPSGSSGEERQAYKMEFLNQYLDLLKKNNNPKKNKLVIAGDYNICHKEIDIHDPKGNKNSSGFLPEERAWMDAFFESGMVDAFRIINQNPHQYSWWSYRANARANNKGWRIDYINVSELLKENISDAAVWPDALHSDHCPIMVKLKI